MTAAMITIVTSFAGSDGWNRRTPAIWTHDVAPFAVAPNARDPRHQDQERVEHDERAEPRLRACGSR